MFIKKKKPTPLKIYDPGRYVPVLRCSICTGEQTAGFRDKVTGAFHDIMLIRDDRDLQEFKMLYGVTELKKEY